MSDSDILAGIQAYHSNCAHSGPGTLFLETAGGVHSPTPSGSSQADLYRPLRLPVCLVADHRLGGISATISAFESLHIRGYDVDVVLQFGDQRYQNHEYLRDYFEKRGVLTLALQPPPKRGSTDEEEYQAMSAFYENQSRLDAVDEMISGLVDKHTTRLERLEEMASKAYKHIWYPFTQHREISPESIMTIDSAYGDFFQTRNTTNTKGKHGNRILESTFDGKRLSLSRQSRSYSLINRLGILVDPGSWARKPPAITLSSLRSRQIRPCHVRRRSPRASLKNSHHPPRKTRKSPPSTGLFLR